MVELTVPAYESNLEKIPCHIGLGKCQWGPSSANLDCSFLCGQFGCGCFASDVLVFMQTLLYMAGVLYLVFLTSEGSLMPTYWLSARCGSPATNLLVRSASETQHNTRRAETMACRKTPAVACDRQGMRVYRLCSIHCQEVSCAGNLRTNCDANRRAAQIRSS